MQICSIKLVSKAHIACEAAQVSINHIRLVGHSLVWRAMNINHDPDMMAMSRERYTALRYQHASFLVCSIELRSQYNSVDKTKQSSHGLRIVVDHIADVAGLQFTMAVDEE